MGDSKDSTGLILLGIIIGVIAFALLSRKTQTLSTQSIAQQQQQQNWQPMDIPRVDDIKPQIQINQPSIKMDPQLIQMTSQLEKTASQLEQATSKLQEAVSRLQYDKPQSQPQQVIIQPIPVYQSPYVTVQSSEQSKEDLQKIQQSDQQQLSNTVYKNNEKWEIIRSKDGRIKSLNIIRDVKKDSQ